MLTAGLSLPSRRLARPDRKHWLSLSVLALILLLNLFAGASLFSIDGGRANAKFDRQALRLAAPGVPPAPEPLAFRDVEPQDALAINASIPVSTLPNPAARPFAIQFASDADRMRSIECLTAAVYYEAAIEPLEGQRAVAQVVLNRVRHPAYPRSICGVVFQGSERATGCQFTFTCDGSLRRTPSAAGWARARQVAEDAIAGKVYKPVGWATHYHTNWVVPYWSSSLVKAANVGSHIFYRWTGGWGRAPAFRHRPSSTEAAIPLMARLTSVPADPADTTDVATAAAALPDLSADMIIPVQADIDMSKRPVLRRYQPLSREQAAAAAIARAAEPPSTSLRWALAGGTSGKPLGQKAQDPESVASADGAHGRAAAPRCLQGVRRLGDKVQGPVDAGC